MDFRTMESIIEGILFAAGTPMPVERIAGVLGVDGATTLSLAKRLSDRYDDERRGMAILILGDSLQMTTRPDYAAHIRSALDYRRDVPLSPAALEVAAIVAYNQPVTRAFIEKVRGVDSDGVVITLMEKGLIEEKGRLDLPGRPRVYGTTPDFLRTFGISTLSDLPEVEGLSDMEPEYPGAGLIDDETDEKI